MSDTKFEVNIIKIPTKLEKRVGDLSETLNKGVENIKKEPVRDEELNK